MDHWSGNSLGALQLFAPSGVVDQVAWLPWMHLRQSEPSGTVTFRGRAAPASAPADPCRQWRPEWYPPDGSLVRSAQVCHERSHELERDPAGHPHRSRSVILARSTMASGRQRLQSLPELVQHQPDVPRRRLAAPCRLLNEAVWIHRNARQLEAPGANVGGRCASSPTSTPPAGIPSRSATRATTSGSPSGISSMAAPHASRATCNRACRSGDATMIAIPAPSSAASLSAASTAWTGWCTASSGAAASACSRTRSTSASWAARRAEAFRSRSCGRTACPAACSRCAARMRP